MAKASRKTTTPQTPGDAYLQILRDLGGDREGWVAGTEHLSRSYPLEGDEPVHWALNPLIFDQEQWRVFEEAASTMGSIMEKVMAKYHRDRSFRPLFGMSPAIEELTLVPSGCHAAVPLSRIDIFFNRATNDYQILGIVTGGVDGMAASGEVVHALHLTNALRTFEATQGPLTHVDAVKGCAQSLLHTYGKWANASEGRNHPTHPSLAVVDVAGSGREAESKTLVNYLEQLGCFARLTEMKTLRLETRGGITQLVDDQGPITCVWLRATPDEALAQGGTGLEALVSATRRGQVCTVGGYRSWPCCTRRFLQLLRSKEGHGLLTRLENDYVRAHVPVTHVIDAASDLSEFYDQERWVLKTADGHQRNSVLAGQDVSRAEWRKRLVKGIKRHDAVQENIQAPVETICGFDSEGAPTASEVDVMLGLYVFEGKLCGVRAICGTGHSIASWADHLEMGCLVQAGE